MPRCAAPPRPLRTPTRRSLACLLGLVSLLLVLDGPAAGGHPPGDPAPRTEAATNPLAGHPWGVYLGPQEQSWQPWVNATGRRKELLGKIALRPKSKWFGTWSGSPAQIGSKVRTYIDNATRGDPDVLVQMTVFRMVPWEAEVDDRLPTRRERRTYKAWIDAFAAAVGDDTRAAIVLQPDGPLALEAPHGSLLPSRLIAYAAARFGGLAHTATYIDAGASDWPAGRPDLAATILQRAGVEHVRGFALNATHYTSTADNIAYGSRVVAELARRGLPGKHFVVDTAENGRPFEFSDYRGSHPNNAKVCTTAEERRCVTLGIPPTTRVADRRWGLSAQRREQARAHVDGYLWFGRPWLYMQTDPFSMERALAMARTTPY
ncbi:glycoside hydrolase family 6 protein [Nocardioides sp. MAHUQ-72]|uniref:glycoside hydrolase family 6 protein n=1 Tax=unclassified Nocardioides TaxID=2615069 RepID=UPI00360CE89E